MAGQGSQWQRVFRARGAPGRRSRGPPGLCCRRGNRRRTRCLGTLGSGGHCCGRSSRHHRSGSRTSSSCSRGRITRSTRGRCGSKSPTCKQCGVRGRLLTRDPCSRARARFSRHPPPACRRRRLLRGGPWWCRRRRLLWDPLAAVAGFLERGGKPGRRRVCGQRLGCLFFVSPTVTSSTSVSETSTTRGA